MLLIFLAKSGFSIKKFDMHLSLGAILFELPPLVGLFMKIKCANCDQKVISFFNYLTNGLETSCPNCKSQLEFKSSKAYRPLVFLNLILIAYIVFKTEDGQLNQFFGYLIIAATFLSTLFFTTITIKSNRHVPKNAKSDKAKSYLAFFIVILAFIYSYLHYDLSISDDLPLIKGLQVMLIVGLGYLIYKYSKK